jgi:hypothetical protein
VRYLLFAGSILLLFGCQQSSTRAPAQTSVSLSTTLKEEGDALAARGEYESAAAKYQLAIAEEPGSLSLHFSLVATWSHLVRRSVTIEQFRWVVNNGQPKSLEVQTARHWLASAGEILESRASGLPPNVNGSPTQTSDLSSPTGKVAGRLEWQGVDPAQRRVIVHLTLAGEDISNSTVKIVRPFRLGQRYTFLHVPAGNYRLAALDAESRTQLWDQKVKVEGDTVLDLNNSNSLIPPEALPGPRE